jgi:hypothetical protein
MLLHTLSKILIIQYFMALSIFDAFYHQARKSGIVVVVTLIQSFASEWMRATSFGTKIM